MKLKRLLSVLTVLALLAAMLPGAALAAETKVSDWDSLAAALAAGGDVALASDVARPEGAATIEVPAGVTAALDLAGCGIDVGGGHTLEHTEDDYFGFRVRGALTLTDSAGTGAVTGSCAVEVLGGSFTLAGGSIETDNDGVYVTDAGTFTMTGGEIAAPFPVTTRNYAQDGTRCTVDLRGGTVRGGFNLPDDPETGEPGDQFGAVDLAGCTLSLSGDVRIVGEVGCSVYLVDSECTMTGGTVDGADVAVRTRWGSRFTMAGGAISAGKSGVSLREGSAFTMTGGEVTAPSAVAAKGDEDLPCAVDVRGGTLRSRGYDKSGSGALSLMRCAVSVSDGAVLDGGENYGAYLLDCETEVSGGAITGGLYVIAAAGGSVALTGGTVRGSDPEAAEAALYAQECDVSVSGDGTFLGGAFLGVSLFDCGIDVSGGTVTGAERGVEVQNGCTVTLRGGEICGEWSGLGIFSGSTAQISGGVLSAPGAAALQIDPGCEAVVTGGELRDSYYGIHNGGLLRLSGAPVFTRITESELALAGGGLRFDGPLTANAPLRVSPTNEPKTGELLVFTEGMPGNFTAAGFAVPCLGYRIAETADGEAALACDFGPAGYDDVARDAWYADDVDYAAHFGLMDAAADGRFAPDAPAARLDAVLALWRCAGCPASDAAIPFADVAADAPSAGAVRWAAETGIVEGVDGALDGDGALTREMFVTMAWRTLKVLGADADAYPGYDLGGLFTDADTVSDWAVEAMIGMTYVNVILGMDDGRLDPQGVLTRSQTAAVAHRLMMYLPA